MSTEQETQVKNCERCAKRCRTVPRRNPDAQVFVKGDAQTGKFCAECLVTDFFKNFDLGPGPEFFEKFDPEGFRLPHIQEQFAAVLAAAKKSYGAEMEVGDFDWDEVIANWHLPFPGKPKGRRKK